jgi:type VII secretion-associated serine protease mycosin
MSTRAAGLLAVALGAAALLVPAGQAAASGQCTPSSPQLVKEYPYAIARFDIQGAWQYATGAGVTVAVVDSGVVRANVHLRQATVRGTNLVPGVKDPAGWQDAAGHGTAVAGEIAARPVKGSGVVGIAPNAHILPVRVFFADDQDSRSHGVGPRNDRIAAGIRYAADHAARIINVSMSTTTDDPALHAAVRYATAKGSLVVASGGNRDTSTDKRDSPRYPGAYPEALAVAALDRDDRVTEDSIHGPHIGVAAPGTDVLTTYFNAGDCLLSSTGDVSTSFATGYVSGAAALVAQRYPAETPAQWKYRLEVTAARPDRARRDDESGWGLIQPLEALSFVADGSALGPPDPAHPAVARPAGSRTPLVAEPARDPLRAAHRRLLWTALAGGGLVAVLLLLGPYLRVRRAGVRPS